MASLKTGGKFVWQPSPQQAAPSRLAQFIALHGLDSYEALLERSVQDPEWFWDAVLKDLDIRFSKPYSRVLDTSRGIEWPQWCRDGRLNIVHNCLDKYADTPVDVKNALRWEGEDGSVRTLTYAELRSEVNRAAAGLRALEVGQGDVVGVFLPMTPETVIAMLAIIKLGGIFLPLFSGFGAESVAARLRDAEAKVLFTADGFHRRGKLVEMKPVADAAAARVPSLQHTIVLRHAGNDVPWEAASDRWWHDWLGEAAGEVETVECNAGDVLMLIYTSGTTGRPKGTVHTHCGFPVKAAQDMAHGLDLHSDENLFWVTDMGWMMGPWEVFGTLLLGATMTLYDGAPDHPHPGRLWELVERHAVTTLGISPTLVRALMVHGEEPVQRHDLASLRKFGSTGEPWNPDPWMWLFEKVGGGTRPIINYSGGTEIGGGILMGNLLKPIAPCSFTGPIPGMAADVVDENGKSVRGEVGELVIRQPWIGMTQGFWRDPQRYLETYWSRFPGVWTHGDWASIDEGDGLYYIHGRSDDTIQIAGKRLGPAEVESILVEHPSVVEAAAIGVPDPLKGEGLVCFCVLHPDVTGDEPLALELRASISNSLGKPFAPREILFPRDLPKTRNAKIMRRLLRAAWLGQDPGDLSSLENPGALRELHQLKSKDENEPKT